MDVYSLFANICHGLLLVAAVCECVLVCVKEREGGRAREVILRLVI